MRRYVVTLILVGAMVAMFVPPAEAMSIRWHARQGTAQVDAAVAPDGSIYTVGSERRSITSVATLTKWDAGGNALWTRHWLPDVQASTHPVAVTVENDGTVYLLGIVRGTCEGQGWFVRAYTPAGALRWKYVTPGWACSIAEAPSGIDVRGHQVVVSGYSFGCCSDTFHDGWVQALGRTLHPLWRSDVEPPSPTPASWFDTGTGVVWGARGTIFVSGWAATRGGITESTPTPGTPLLERFTRKGTRMWSVRANVAVPSMFLPVSVDAKGTRVDIATGINGQGAGWGVAPTTGWVASYAPGGTQRWQRRFGGGHDTAALPTGIAIGAHQRVWIESTVRDANDRGTDVLIRTYRAGGSFIGKMRIDQAVRYLTSGAIVTVGSGAAATGWVGTRYRFKGGRVWRLAR